MQLEIVDVMCEMDGLRTLHELRIVTLFANILIPSRNDMSCSTVKPWIGSRKIW